MYEFMKEGKIMKRWMVTLLCFAMLLSMSACSSKTESAAPMEDPVVSGNSGEDPVQKIEEISEEEPKEESKEEPKEEPKEDHKSPAAENEDKLPQSVVGIWSSKEGLQTDDAAECHNYYVCLLEDGMAFRFSWSVMGIGTWIVGEKGHIQVFYDRNSPAGLAEGWEEYDYFDETVYSVEQETGMLHLLSSNSDNDFSSVERYYPADRADAVEKGLAYLKNYHDQGLQHWMTQRELNSGTSAVAAVYDGLERYTYDLVRKNLSEEKAMQLASEEEAWRTDKEIRLQDVKAEFEGGSMMAMMVNETRSVLADLRIDSLLDMDGAGSAQMRFEDFPEEFLFASGAGGWSTSLSIADDGTFSGLYADYDLGVTGEDYPNGTVYYSAFSGKFSEPVQVNSYVWSMQLESLALQQEPGGYQDIDGMRYCYVEPYGMENTNEFLIYTPGMAVDDMSKEFMAWAWTYGLSSGETMPEGWYGILNTGSGNAFIGQPR